jgi:ABC-type amino acid transport system permease subunit
MVVNNAVRVSKKTCLISITEINELVFREKTVIVEKYSLFY